MKHTYPLDAIWMICVLFIIILTLPACSSLPPEPYVMDSQQLCLESAIWETTGTGWGRGVESCAAISGWSQERRILDGAK